MIEVSVPMRRHDRVAALTRQHAAWEMSGSSVQVLGVDALEHDFVEVDARYDETSDRRSVGRRRLGTSAERNCSRVRDRAARMSGVPLATRLVRSRDSDGVSPADERQQESAGDEKGKADKLTHGHVRAESPRA